MNDDFIKLSDNPTIETQLYVMARAINALLKDSKEVKSDLGAIKLLQREQNGNVARVMEQANRLERRQDAHDDWHGDEDERIIKRAHEEELKQAEERGMRKLLGIEINIIKWAVGGGLVGVGLAMGKVINWLGLW